MKKVSYKYYLLPIDVNIVVIAIVIDIIVYHIITANFQTVHPNITNNIVPLDYIIKFIRKKLLELKLASNVFK